MSEEAKKFKKVLSPLPTTVQCGFKKIQLFLGHPVEQKGWPNDIALQYYEFGVVYYSGENNHVPIGLFSNND